LIRPLFLASLAVALAFAGVIAWLATAPVEDDTDEVYVALRAPDASEPADAPTPADTAPDDTAIEETPEFEVTEPDVAEPDVTEPELEDTLGDIEPEPEPGEQLDAPETDIAVSETDIDEEFEEEFEEDFEEEVYLEPAPHPSLVEETPVGLLPIIAPDGSQSWQVYARPYDDSAGLPQIAVVIGELGLNQAASYQAIQLPGEVTLAFAPYARDLEGWIDQARMAGHEVLLEVPMEPTTFPNDDPGPRALLTSLKPDENIQRLEWLLGRFVGYVGVTDHMGSSFASSRDHLEPVLRALKNRGLMYLDIHGPGNPLPAEIAAGLSMFHVARDVDLDIVTSRERIAQQLAEAERIALESGAAVAMGRPFPVTIDLLANWLPALAEKGIAVVPVTAVAAHRRAE
jgi:polysaccharide deacetylase 2 family uncharacterized protein YibQ